MSHTCACLCAGWGGVHSPRVDPQDEEIFEEKRNEIFEVSKEGAGFEEKGNEIFEVSEEGAGKTFMKTWKDAPPLFAFEAALCIRRFFMCVCVCACMYEDTRKDKFVFVREC
jgi:hypothetical protein